MKTAFTIAGSDPSGGAGIQADIKTFQAHGVFGMSVITAVTVQNTQKVYSVQEINPQMVYDQIVYLFEDIRIDAVKIGMVSSIVLIETIAKALKKVNPPVVILDPVMISKSGYRLLNHDAQKALVRNLFPVAEVVTPNVYEAEALTGMKITTENEMKTAAAKILKLGAKKVVVKGGHLDGKQATDILYDGDTLHGTHRQKDRNKKHPWYRLHLFFRHCCKSCQRSRLFSSCVGRKGIYYRRHRKFSIHRSRPRAC